MIQSSFSVSLPIRVGSSDCLENGSPSRSELFESVPTDCPSIITRELREDGSRGLRSPVILILNLFFVSYLTCQSTSVFPIGRMPVINHDATWNSLQPTSHSRALSVEVDEPELSQQSELTLVDKRRKVGPNSTAEVTKEMVWAVYKAKPWCAPHREVMKSWNTIATELQARSILQAEKDGLYVRRRILTLIEIHHDPSKSWKFFATEEIKASLEGALERISYEWDKAESDKRLQTSTKVMAKRKADAVREAEGDVLKRAALLSLVRTSGNNQNIQRTANCDTNEVSQRADSDRIRQMSQTSDIENVSTEPTVSSNCSLRIRKRRGKGIGSKFKRVSKRQQIIGNVPEPVAIQEDMKKLQDTVERIENLLSNVIERLPDSST